jgi:hypothetical protein
MVSVSNLKETLSDCPYLGELQLGDVSVLDKFIPCLIVKCVHRNVDETRDYKNE